MKDIQSQRDHRRINIKKVGVKTISYPVTVLDKAKRVQRTVAKVNMYVNLPHRFKGTHMSRFIEILNRFHGAFDLKSFHLILEEMKLRLEAQAAHMEIEFPYFLRKAPSCANAVGIVEYKCKMHGVLDRESDLTVEVEVPISPPLPDQFNEELPRSLGHWGVARVCLRLRHFIWIEDLIQMVEDVIAHIHRGVPNSGRSLYRSRSEDGRPPAAMPSVEKIAKALGRVLADHAEDICWFNVMVENLAEGYSTFATLEWPEVRSDMNESQPIAVTR